MAVDVVDDRVAVDGASSHRSVAVSAGTPAENDGRALAAGERAEHGHMIRLGRPLPDEPDAATVDLCGHSEDVCDPSRGDGPPLLLLRRGQL